MRISALVLTLVAVGLLTLAEPSLSQARQRKDNPQTDRQSAAQSDDYSGMYTFLAEGEFVQLNIEDGGKVTGYVSRYGSLDSDRGAFLDQFIKTGSLKDRQIQWTTEPVHGVWYDFKGTIGRGKGKTPDDEGYFAMQGILVEHVTDAARKESARQREVVLKSFPQGLGDEHEKRD